jgi:non-specific serine/threonine protein kinase
MLFDDSHFEEKKTRRPKLPSDAPKNFLIGFLFNFISGKSTRFDLEPVLILERHDYKEYKRISIESEMGLAYLQYYDQNFYDKLLLFSNKEILKWMSSTGNRFVMDDRTGSWAHATVKELKNLRKRYVELLTPLWPQLCATPELFMLTQGKFSGHATQTVKLSPEPFQLKVYAESEKGEIILRPAILLNGIETHATLRCGVLMEHENILYLPPNTEALSILDFFKTGTQRFPLSLKKEITKKYLLPWREKFEVIISEKLKIEESAPDLHSRVRLSELNESNLMIRAEFEYGSEVVEYDNETKLLLEEGDRLLIVNRNKANEKQLHEYLRTLHSAFASQRMNSYYYLPFDEVMKKGWFIGMMHKVQDEGYAIHGLSDLKKFRYNVNIPKFNVAVKTKADWFELKVNVQWGDQEVPLKEIRRAILNWQDTIMLEDGTLGHIPEEWVKQYSVLLRTGKEVNGKLQVSKLHYTLLDEILDKLDDKGREEVETRKRKLLEYDSIEKVPLSREVKASLRPYQLSGFNWMQSLDELGWGGCLADDMGLGKTLQTISFLQFVKEKYPGSTQLVVCPTSLIFNWESELKKFCPSIKFHVNYGVQREFTETHFEEYDVVLTSYGLVRNDIDSLSGFLWQYIILDESQSIKNPDARITKAVQKLRSVNRIILSGTPVQNNTFDLFSQFNFLNPGLLGNREFFNREFATPIDKDGNREKAQHLRKLVHPFTLRRTKEQVAKDLPEKTITVLWCNMEAGQRRLYNEVRDGYRTRLLKKIDDEGIGRAGMDVLEALLRLRQICDHPALVPNLIGEEEKSGSVKIDEIIREVTENAGGHKLLIFSQFTEMLKLIQEQFEENNVSHCYLDGSTPLKKRQEEVERFQSDETVKAFLISLKAGGVGLNLTVADYVYIVDPWWNPAAEQQAIDRAHRIGQKRSVFAYKMICKDSVEEKILQLQERKKKLADDLIQEDASFVKTLTRDDVAFLLG